MKRATDLLRLLALALAGAALSAQAFDFVADGKAKPVVIPANAAESTKLAATEFTNYIFKASGVMPEVEVGGVDMSAHATRDASGTVRIGTLATLADVPEAIRELLKGEESLDAFVTGEVGGRYWIVGKDDVAELYGVYRTLEQQLGVRWFKPELDDDPGEYVPKAETVVLADALRMQAPFFSQRHLDITGSSVAYLPTRGVTWAYRAGLQVNSIVSGYEMVKALATSHPGPGTKKLTLERWRLFKPRTQVARLELGGGHMMFLSAAPADKYFDTHPEYFALRDGKRVKGDYYCHSNDELRQLVADYAIKCLRETGGRGKYLFGLQDRIDSAGACECENCRALDSEAERKLPPNTCISTRFHTTAADIAQRIYKVYPEADYLHTWAYNIYREPPDESVKFDPRMWVELCIRRCYGHAIDDPKCAKNVTALKWLRGWRALIAERRCHTYEYGNCSHQFYAPYETRFAHDLKVYRELGLAGWKEEMTFADSTAPSRFGKDPERLRQRSEKPMSNWQWFYVAGKLLWDPDLDLAEVLADAESKYYGAAYPAMRKYHALRRRLWDGQTMCMGYPNGDGRTPNALNEPGSKEELLKLLDEADALAKDDALVGRRLANDRRWLTEYWIKPNDKLKAHAGKALRAPLRKGAIAIDGKGDELDWAGAHWVADFERGTAKGVERIPAALATKVGILSDADNLYFLVEAKEPAMDRICRASVNGRPLYRNSEFEILLYPPSEGNSYYQIMTDCDGKLNELQHQPSAPGAFGTEVAATRRADGFTIELRVPVKRMHPLIRGESWRVMMLRQRELPEADAFSPKSAYWSIDGVAPHNTGAYRPMEIGNPYLVNGGFEKFDAKGLPEAWSIKGGASVVTNGVLHALRIVGAGRAYQGLHAKGLGQSDEPRKISYSFKAKGRGRVTVSFYRYHDTPDFKAPHRYRRDCRPSEQASVHAVSAAEATCRGEYSIKSGEWASIILSGDKDGDVTIDDVSVCPVK